MKIAYIVDAVRTPMGRRQGSLSGIHPVDLGAFVLSGLLERTGVDPADVDDVIFGCINQIGSQAANLARNAWLSAGLPETVPGVTIDRQCGSSQQAIHFAAQGVLAGAYDVVIAGGLEAMSQVPLNSSFEVGPKLGFGIPFDATGWVERYGADQVHQFVAGDLIAEKWDIGRAEMETFALDSHRKAARAWDEGRFDREVLPVGKFSRDETIRAETSLEAMAALKPLRDGRITAATACQIADGAAAVLIASQGAVDRLRLQPRAIVRSMVAVGSDPKLMLTGPIPATRKALIQASLNIDDIDLFECNEAFSSVVLAWCRETKAPLEKTNVNGGALALGHALGATGARLLTTLLSELERTNTDLGLQTVCEGGGLANATIIQRIS